MMYDAIYAIAAQGMRLEKMRVDVVANNIANQHTLRTPDGTSFQPLQVISHAISFETLLQGQEAAAITLEKQTLPPNKIYQPGHPAADKAGYVTYPGISTVDEMTTLLRASRAYEANVTVINTAHSLYRQALSIGEER